MNTKSIPANELIALARVSRAEVVQSAVRAELSKRGIPAPERDTRHWTERLPEGARIAALRNLYSIEIAGEGSRWTANVRLAKNGDKIAMGLTATSEREINAHIDSVILDDVRSSEGR